MGIIEKLGITPGPWRVCENGDIIDTEGYFQARTHSEIGKPERIKNDSLLIATAPEMLEALIHNTIYLEGKISGEKCNHTINVCYCKDMAIICKNIIIIEKACYPKKWEEIKGLL